MMSALLWFWAGGAVAFMACWIFDREDWQDAEWAVFIAILWPIFCPLALLDKWKGAE